MNERVQDNLQSLIGLSVETGLPAKALEQMAIDGIIPSVLVGSERKFNSAAVRAHLQSMASDEPCASRPVTAKELRAAFPTISSDYLVAVLEQEATMDQAMTMLIELQGAQLKKLDERLKEQKRELDERKRR